MAIHAYEKPEKPAKANMGLKVDRDYGNKAENKERGL